MTFVIPWCSVLFLRESRGHGRRLCFLSALRGSCSPFGQCTCDLKRSRKGKEGFDGSCFLIPSSLIENYSLLRLSMFCPDLSFAFKVLQLINYFRHWVRKTFHPASSFFAHPVLHLTATGGPFDVIQMEAQ